MRKMNITAATAAIKSQEVRERKQKDWLAMVEVSIVAMVSEGKTSVRVPVLQDFDMEELLAPITEALFSVSDVTNAHITISWET